MKMIWKLLVPSIYDKVCRICCTSSLSPKKQIFVFEKLNFDGSINLFAPKTGNGDWSSDLQPS